jgi:UDP-perosamine 4-acetyltransferase
LLGAGGHATVLLDALLAAKLPLPIVALDNNPTLRGSSLFDVPIVGDDQQLETMIEQHGLTAFINGVGSAGPTIIHQRVYEQGLASGLEPLTIIHPGATLSAYAGAGPGLQMLAGSIVNPGTQIGSNVLINTGAIVEHDCHIGDHVHIATGARFAGNVTVEHSTHIGIGASIRQGIRIGASVIVGAGAVVVNDVPSGAVVVGVPARPVRSKAD